ncbi:EAL domain-containing protein [Sulfurovum sp. AR]|uniref:EAL domain-containing protein n=1 Tax=Sulfurovum sp. AR TaxID=1165841 RepID=UPI00025C4F40|nr:EAL domain-containing protein [Sulfurovum sp. AR]EIF50680.1 diguanylate cyclase/phosphodiesterase [Sulfurovum sp. AR]
MLDNMHFYDFMHKQILVVIALFAGTGIGYLYIGWLYSSSLFPELLWFCFVLLLSFWGYRLHRSFLENDLNMQQKEQWLGQLRYFLFSYFSVWTIMFLIYTSRSDIELHYVAIATQLGVTVVSATILASQKKLAVFTLVTLMLPLTLYFIFVSEFYSYLLAFFTIVLGGVLLYAAHNTFNYLIKSQFQAYHDALTTLGNRRYFIELLNDAMKSQKHDHQHIYLLLIDLDHFKTINDTLGHDIGDVLLCQAADRMRVLSKKHQNFVSRLGGDEFCILSTSFATEQECLHNASQFAEELLTSIRESYHIEEHSLYISASIGVSIISDPKMEASNFIKEADIAMYEAKGKGRNGIIFFNDTLAKHVEWKLEIERLLHFSLQRNEITLTYQPQYSPENEIIGCEVLSRWDNETLGEVSPTEFIPISEKTGFIIELGYYILKEAFITFKKWDEKGIVLEQMSINVSMRQLFHYQFINDVKYLCDTYLTKAQRSKIIFEITETSVAEDITKLIRNMKVLQNYGIRFSMDDFGTGYSSLSYLRQLPINEIKIDKSFISELHHLEDEEDKCFVETIFTIAKNLKLKIVAEGIENEEQRKFIVDQKCDILQGYYFSEPVQDDAFETLFLEAKNKKTLNAFDDVRGLERYQGSM